MKYDMLNRIGAANWAPIDHNSNIISALAMLIYQIGTQVRINFGEYFFERKMKHVVHDIMSLSD